MKRTIVVLVAAILTGCTATMLSDERIRSNTAGVLGTAESEISLSERRTQGVNTYYVATKADGSSYACVINGGNLLTMGVVNAPICHKR